MLAGLGVLITPATQATAAPPTQGWTSVQAPLPSDSGNGSTNPRVYIASSVCPQANGCVTVGWYDDTTGRPWGLIEQQNGTSWSDTEAPQPSTAASGGTQGFWFGSPNCGVATEPCRAVSCPTTTFCVAAGSFNLQGGGQAPVVDTFNGSSWSSTQVPLPNDKNASTFGFLQSVSCSSSTSCVGVGSYRNTSNVAVGLIATLSGSTWSVQATPQPSDISTTSPFSGLTNVSCASSTACVAVGSYSPTVGGSLGLIAQLVNGNWSALSAPLPSNKDTAADPFTALYDVQCPTTGFCVAVGGYQKSTPIYAGLIDTFSGGAWSATQAPEPSLSANTDATLFGVSCPTTTSCGAVGAYDDSASGRPRGLIDQLAGGNWSATSAPQPSDSAPESGQFMHLETITCPTPSFCSASGYYENTSLQGAGLVVTLQGASWTAMTALLPGASSSSYAKSVACYSPVACVVAGWFTDSSNNVEGFLDTWTGAQGYWLDATDGGVFAFPNNAFYGSTGNLVLNKPMVGMSPTPDGQGYWLVASDGGVFNYGDATFQGSAGNLHLNKPVVGMASTPTGKGYWLVASDGGIFTYGDAQFYGSTGNLTLNKPIVGMATTPDGAGYWLVASDGGIFSYGDAVFYGSTGNLKLNKPVVGMAATPTGMGYWLVASDGGVFTFGDGNFYGSTGNLVLNKPVVGMASSPSGLGYWLVASDGGVFNYGDAPFQGSTGNLTLKAPIVGIAGG